MCTRAIKYPGNPYLIIFTDDYWQQCDSVQSIVVSIAKHEIPFQYLWKHSKMNWGMFS